jgi:hypothetical protein
VNRLWPRLLALVGAGAVASQAGHLLVYQLQYGSAALSVESKGAHTYFPVFAKTSLGLAALVVMAALLIIGATRLVAVRPGTTITRSPSYVRLLAALFTIQITCFVLQETIESAVAGASVASAPHLFLLGTVGQLPIAAVVALALKWLLIRLETAFTILRQVLATRVNLRGQVAIALAPLALAPQLALVDTCPAVFVKRGPPLNLRR